jgi:hypothetical protein
MKHGEWLHKKLTWRQHLSSKWQYEVQQHPHWYTYEVISDVTSCFLLVALQGQVRKYPPPPLSVCDHISFSIPA